MPVYNHRSKLCLPLDGRRCARLSEKGVGWIGEQALRMLLAAKLDYMLDALRGEHAGLSIFGIEPARQEIPMFMHNVISSAARKELLDYGYMCGRAFEAGGRSFVQRALRADHTENEPHVGSAQTIVDPEGQVCLRTAGNGRKPENGKSLPQGGQSLLPKVSFLPYATAAD